MGQTPAAGCAGAAGCAPARAKRSPTRPAVTPAAAAAAAANVGQIATNLACAELDLLNFNFQSRYSHIFIPTPITNPKMETLKHKCYCVCLIVLLNNLFVY
jgi:hypothetical protein